MYVTVVRDRLFHLMTCDVVMHPSSIARGQTWLCQPLPVSTVPNTVRNLSNSSYRGLDDDDEYVCFCLSGQIGSTFLLVKCWMARCWKYEVKMAIEHNRAYYG